MVCAKGIDSIEVLSENGNPSILFQSLNTLNDSLDDSLEHYLITKSPEFKEWYSNGKMDENGEPVFEDAKFVNEFGEIKTAYNFQKLYDPIEKTKKIYDEIRDVVNRRLAIYKNRIDKDSVIKELEELNEKVNTLDELEAISLFIKDASSKSAILLDRMKQRFDGKNLSEIQDKKEAIDFLAEAKDYIDGFTIIKELSDIVDDINDTETGAKLREAQSNFNQIQNRFKSVAPKLLGNYLYTALRNVDLTEQNKVLKSKGKAEVTEEYVIKQLEESTADIGWMNLWLDPMINSQDLPFALYGKLIKAQQEKARAKDIENNYILQTAKQAYINATGRSENNTAKFYEPFTERIKDEKGVEQIRLVSSVDYKTFYENKAALLKNSTSAQRGKWYAENCEPQYDSAGQKVTILDDFGNPRIQYDLDSPLKTKYINQNYKNLSQAEKTFLNVLTDNYLYSQSSLPKSYRRGLVLPSIRKDNVDRFNENGLKSVLNEAKDSFKIRETDTQYGIQDQSGNEVKSIPIYYTQYLDANEVSSDVIPSLLKFGQMANNYKALGEVYSEIQLMTDVIGMRKTALTNAKGENVFDSLSNKIGLKKLLANQNEANSVKSLREFNNAVVYGRYKEKENPKAMALEKAITKYTSLNSLGLNFLGSFNNVLLAKLTFLMESIGAKHYTPKDLAVAETKYMGNILGIINDANSNLPKSKWGLLFEKYDPIQGNFKKGLADSQSMTKKAFSTSNLFFMNNMGEHFAQSCTLIALMNNRKVKDANGNLVAMDEAYEIVNGRLEVLPEFQSQITPEIEEDIRNTVHALNKQMHGVYEDNVAADRYIIGRLARLFRKYIRSGFKSRYENTYFDVETNKINRGYYNTFFNFCKQFLQDPKTVLVMSSKYNELEDFEKAGIRKTVGEIGLVLAFSLAYAALPDDDDDYLTSFTKYQIARTQSDMLFYTNPTDILRQFKSPSASFSSVNKVWRLLSQLTDPLEEYERSTGSYDKGDLKLKARFYDAVPIITQIENTTNPDEQLKMLNATRAF